VEQVFAKSIKCIAFLVFLRLQKKLKIENAILHHMTILFCSIDSIAVATKIGHNFYYFLEAGKNNNQLNIKMVVIL
jgi:hypothetical protein